MRRREAAPDPAVPEWVLRFVPADWQVGLVVRDDWPTPELAADYEAWHRWVEACGEWRDVHGGPFAPGTDPVEDDLWTAIGEAA